MDESLQRRIDSHWARRLGCDPALLRAPGVHALAAGEGGARRRVFLLARDATLLLHGEEAVVRALAEHLGEDPSLPAEARLRAALGARAGRAIGPALLLHREGPPVTPAGAGEPRPFAASDRAALARLRDAVTAPEWERSGLGHRGEPAATAGVFESGVLLAAAGFETIAERVARLGVITHTAARGLGAGRRAAALAAQQAAGRSLLLEYPSLEANAASLRIASVLGFSPYARCLAIELAGSARALAPVRAVGNPRGPVREPAVREERAR